MKLFLSKDKSYRTVRWSSEQIEMALMLQKIFRYVASEAVQNETSTMASGVSSNSVLAGYLQDIRDYEKSCSELFGGLV